MTFNRIVAYDLRQPGRNYQPLWDELRRLGGVPVLKSDWALNTTHSCKELRDHLRNYVDGNDKLLVTQVEDWAALNATN